MTDMLVAVLAYIGKGWSPVPVPYKKKGPIIDAWQGLRIGETDAPRYFNGAPQNVGVILGAASGGLTDIDLDCAEAIRAAPYLLPRTATFGHAPSKPASHYLYRSDLAATEDRAAIKYIGSDKHGLLEIRTGGGGRAAQTIFPPSVHTSGEPIAWEGGAAGKIADVDGEELLKCAGRLAAAAELARNYPKEGGRHDGARILGGFLARCGFSPALAACFVEAVAAASNQPAEKRADMKRTARDGANVEKRPGFPLLAEVFGALVANKVAKWLEYQGRDEDSPETPAAQPADPPRFSDIDLALRFADRHAHHLRFVADWGKWLKWDGQRWRFDTTLAAFDLARSLCRDEAASCKGARIKKMVASAKTVAAVISLARAERRIAATVDQWDADPRLLNTPSGVVD